MNNNKRGFSDTFAERDDFQIAILCALPLESHAVEQIFDEIYETEGLLWQKSNGDRNSYTSGKIGRHNVVLAHMPGIGKVKAAMTASSIRATFRNISLALVVGICGVAPTTPEGKHIYLGDVVVSTKILQSDFGRELTDQFVIKGPEEGNLGPAGAEIQSFLTKVQGPFISAKVQERARKNTNILLAQSKLNIPETQEDILFESDYIHQHHPVANQTVCATCSAGNRITCKIAKLSTCLDLDCTALNAIRTRTRNIADGPRIFYGPISSSDSVRKNGTSRDQFMSQHHVFAFEMEGAGVWDILPTIVIKAACDYADSHKHKKWQIYAAVSAAATSRSILDEWQTSASLNNYRPGENSEGVAAMTLLHKQYLNSLDFKYLDLRVASIEPAHATTCSWLFNTSWFLSWLEPADAEIHHRLLWIKGKPGAGKSTLMKYIHQSAKDFLPRHTIAAFYFHARGDELQKSRLGMLRSILFQLLEANPTLLARFVIAFPLHKHINIEDRVWYYEELQNFLLLAAQQGWLRQTVIFIDAVDECAEDEARELVAFCENLALNAIAQRTPIYLCLSSRHYPNISLQKGLQFNLDTAEGHCNDIKRYISDRLHSHDLSLSAEILRRSNSVFLWAKLVISMLNTTLDKGANSTELRTQVDSVPPMLESIYEKLFEGLDNTLQARTVLFMQLVLFAAESLNPRALYLLTIAGSSPAALRPWDSCGMTDEAIALRFYDISRGLAEITHNGVEPVVQLIHETVREFLLQYRDKQNIHHAMFNPSTCHIVMAKSCLASLSISDYPRNYVELQNFPHIRYALQYILYHIGCVLDESDVGLLLEQYCEHIPKFLWFYLRGCQKHLKDGQVLRAIIMSDHCRNERILEAIFNKSRSSLPEAHSFHEKDFIDTFRAAKERSSFRCIDVLLLAAINSGTLNKRGQTTVEAVINLYIPDEPSGLCWHVAYVQRGVGQVVLVDGLPALLEHMSQLYKTVARRTHHPWGLPRLISSFINAWSSLTEPDRRVVVKFTIEESSFDGLQMLIEAGIDICIELSPGMPALLLAVICCYKNVRSIDLVQLLLIRGASANACDAAGVPTIFYAIGNNSPALVEMLLDHGADMKSNAFHVSALHCAAYVGAAECLSLLVSRGLDIDVRDDYGRSAIFALATSTHYAGSLLDILPWYRHDNFYAAAAVKFSDMTKTFAMLVTFGADLSLVHNVALPAQRTLLHICAAAADTKAVKRLIKEGFPLNATDENGNTALYYAAVFTKGQGCYDSMVQQGADASQRNIDGVSPNIMLIERKRHERPWRYFHRRGRNFG